MPAGIAGIEGDGVFLVLTEVHLRLQLGVDLQTSTGTSL